MQIIKQSDLIREAEQAERNLKRLVQWLRLRELNKLRATIGLSPVVPPVEVMK